jgi:hypothetical protein
LHKQKSRRIFASPIRAVKIAFGRVSDSTLLR